MRLVDNDRVLFLLPNYQLAGVLLQLNARLVEILRSQIGRRRVGQLGWW